MMTCASHHRMTETFRELSLVFAEICVIVFCDLIDETSRWS